MMKRSSQPALLLVYLKSGDLIDGFTVKEVHQMIVSYFERLYNEKDDEEIEPDE